MASRGHLFIEDMDIQLSLVSELSHHGKSDKVVVERVQQSTNDKIVGMRSDLEEEDDYDTRPNQELSRFERQLRGRPKEIEGVCRHFHEPVHTLGIVRGQAYPVQRTGRSVCSSMVRYVAIKG